MDNSLLAVRDINHKYIVVACKEIKDALARDEKAPEYQVKRKEIAPKEPEIENAKPASDEVKNKTYTMFFSMLVLAETHKQSLLKRGFTEEQIEQNGYKSTPVFGFRRITKKLIEADCTVKGVPGFYQEKNGEWTILMMAGSTSGSPVPIIIWVLRQEVRYIW